MMSVLNEPDCVSYKLSLNRALFKMLKSHGKRMENLHNHRIWLALEEICDAASNPAGMLVRFQFFILTLDRLQVKDLQAKHAVEAKDQSKGKARLVYRILGDLCCSVLVPTVEDGAVFERAWGFVFNTKGIVTSEVVFPIIDIVQVRLKIAIWSVFVFLEFRCTTSLGA